MPNIFRKLSDKLAGHKDEYDLLLDSDNDGLSDSEERNYGTDPNNYDTDKDGLSDYQEVNVYHTDPLNPDTDKDGVSDGEEVRSGTNPLGAGQLKDFFYSYPGNNYHPKFLHPGRIAWYGFSSLLIKFIVVAFVAAMPLSAWLTPDVAKEQAQKIIYLTNSLRSQKGLKALNISQPLMSAAYDKAEDMIINQYFSHFNSQGQGLSYWLKKNNYAYDLAGENLALGYTDAGSIMKGWLDSRTHYDNLIDADYTEIGVAVLSGQYNGAETTLAAQFFALPSRPKTAPSKLSANSQPASKSVAPAAAAKTVQPAEVLGDKVAIELSKPVLLSPRSFYVGNQEVLVITASAVGAEKVWAVIDDWQIVELASNGQGIYDAQVELSDGTHTVQVKAQAGDQIQSSGSVLATIDTQPPLADIQRSSISVISPQANDDLAVRVEAYLSPDTTEAEVRLGSALLALQPEGDGKWSGADVISAKENRGLLNPVILASLSAKDGAGNVSLTDIKWENIKPIQPPLLDQYFLARESGSDVFNLVFGLSRIYFQVILGLAIMALAFNIFVNIRVQQPKVIVPSMGLIMLLAVLLVI